MGGKGWGTHQHAISFSLNEKLKAAQCAKNEVGSRGGKEQRWTSNPVLKEVRWRRETCKRSPKWWKGASSKEGREESILGRWLGHGRRPSAKWALEKDRAQEEAGEMGRAAWCRTLWHSEHCGFFYVCNENSSEDLMQKNGIIEFALKWLVYHVEICLEMGLGGLV